MSSDLERQECLRRLLCPFWLRPESALWYAHEAVLARQYLALPLCGPSLEFGCMDGTASFVMLGGEFGPAFDVYSEVKWDRDSKHWLSMAQDYYDVSREAGSAGPDIVGHPGVQFSVGLSWKRAHLDKAARLGIHARLIEHDPNAPLGMFDDSEFATVWAPNLYWVDALRERLLDFRRLLRPDGRLVTVLPDKAALNHMLFRFAEEADVAWLRDLDRGRYGNIGRVARTLDGWIDLFQGCGLKVSHHQSFIHTPVFLVNDVGFRPMFPTLMDVYETLQRLSPPDWLRIKTHWMETAYHFLAPLCATEWMDRMGLEKVWHIFELRRDGEGS